MRESENCLSEGLQAGPALCKAGVREAQEAVWFSGSEHWDLTYSSRVTREKVFCLIELQFF